MMDWLSSHGPWSWLSPPSALVAVLTWLGRRRGWRPWRTLVSQTRLNAEIESCRQALASCEENRTSEERGRRAAIVALEEMVKAGSLVAKAAEEGRLTTPGGSSSRRTSLPSGSTGSRRRRKRGPLDLP